MDDRAATFEQHRRRLFGVAYRMLGSAAEAEDAVQEAWLRFAGADAAAIDRPGAWLTAVVTRLCLDQLKSARVRRETYVGPWLPEPLRTDGDIDPDSIRTAFLVLLERLTPHERAVLILHDVFDHAHVEIGAMIERDEAACRQLLHRARAHVEADRPRFIATREDQQRLLSGFLGAVSSGDLDALRAILTEDARLATDSGGKQRAARNVVRGSDAIARGLIGIYRKGYDGAVAAELTEINGAPGALIKIDGRVAQVLTLDLDGDRIRGVYVQLNPDKLRRLR